MRIVIGESEKTVAHSISISLTYFHIHSYGRVNFELIFRDPSLTVTFKHHSTKYPRVR